VLTKYGFDVLLKYLGVLLAVLVITFLFLSDPAARIAICSVDGIFILLVLNFFRDPNRNVPKEDGIVVSPADGNVVVVKEADEPEYLNSRALQVSIFMSPLDVHVNRFPVTGTVEYFRHVEGEFLAAFEEKSSELNERTHIGIAWDGRKLLFKQIAGAVARRIVADLKVGQPAVIGERFGMIKFGSRVDILLPMDAKIAVKVGDRVTAGESIVARFGSELREKKTGRSSQM
jgi:phosphatidylserine decarboxylase